MQFNSRVLSIADYPSAELAQRKRKLQQEGKKIFDFGTGDPIEPTAAFIREAVTEGVPVISQYPSVWGTLELRRSIGGYIARRFGVEVDPEKEILPCTGSKEAIYNIHFLLIGPGNSKDIVISGVPGYFVMERSAIVAGAHFYPFYLNEDNRYLLDLSVLPEEVLKRTAIVWLNYPHNPTGAEADLAYLARQVEIAKRYEILLCSDESYVDLYFSANRPPSILQIAKEGVLAFHSCSKRSGMTAYRSGFVAGDKGVLSHFAAFRNTIGTAPPPYTQHASLKAWNDDKHVEERQKAFRIKRDLFLPFFKKMGLGYIDTDAGIYFWVKTPGKMSGKEYALRLMEHGIIVGPGEFFGKNCVDYFRLALVPSADDCREAIKIWEGLSI